MSSGAGCCSSWRTMRSASPSEMIEARPKSAHERARADLPRRRTQMSIPLGYWASVCKCRLRLWEVPHTALDASDANNARSTPRGRQLSRGRAARIRSSQPRHLAHACGVYNTPRPRRLAAFTKLRDTAAFSKRQRAARLAPLRPFRSLVFGFVNIWGFLDR